MGEIMPRATALTRVNPATGDRQDSIEILRFTSSNTNCRLVAEDGTSAPISKSMLLALNTVAAHFELGHAVRILDSEAEFLTPNEAAQLLGVSRPTILNLIEAGVLTAENALGSNSHRRIPLDQVDALRRERGQFTEGMNSALALARGSGLATFTPRRSRSR